MRDMFEGVQGSCVEAIVMIVALVVLAAGVSRGAQTVDGQRLVVPRDARQAECAAAATGGSPVTMLLASQRGWGVREPADRSPYCHAMDRGRRSPAASEGRPTQQ